MKIRKNQIRNLVLHLLDEMKIKENENLVNECTEYLMKICESEKCNKSNLIVHLFASAKDFLKSKS